METHNTAHDRLNLPVLPCIALPDHAKKIWQVQNIVGSLNTPISDELTPDGSSYPIVRGFSHQIRFQNQTPK